MADSFDSLPFEEGDIKLKVLKNTLRTRMRIDRLLLEKLGVGVDELDAVANEKIVEAFNSILESPSLYKKIDPSSLSLSPEIANLFKLAQKSESQGQPVDPAILKTLNRALFHVLYPKETVIKTRRFKRFAPELMEKTHVTLSPLPPKVGVSLFGKMMNVSAGGMALMLDQIIPQGTYMALKILFQDHTEMETIVQLKHSVPQNDHFIHGFQFVSIPSYLTDKLTK